MRGTGKPYTKRILPEHLIPRSPLWGKSLVDLLTGEPERRSAEAACAALGCIDPRTARKHIRALGDAVAAKLPILAELGASAPGMATAIPPGMNAFAILGLLWSRFLTTIRELSGSQVSDALRPLLWLGPGLQTFRFFNRSCIPIPGLPGLHR